MISEKSALSSALGRVHLGACVSAKTPKAQRSSLPGRICCIKPLPWQQGNTCRALQLTLGKISPVLKALKVAQHDSEWLPWSGYWLGISAEQRQGIKGGWDPGGVGDQAQNILYEKKLFSNVCVCS